MRVVFGARVQGLTFASFWRHLALNGLDLKVMSSKKSTPSSTPKESKTVSVTVKVNKSPNEALALTNNVFLHPDDAKALELPKELAGALPVSNYVKIKNFIYNFQYPFSTCFPFADCLFFRWPE
jgi:hypothetical protein